LLFHPESHFDGRPRAPGQMGNGGSEAHYTESWAMWEHRLLVRSAAIIKSAPRSSTTSSTVAYWSRLHKWATAHRQE